MSTRLPSGAESRDPAILPNHPGLGPALAVCVLAAIAASSIGTASARERTATGFVMRNHAPFASLIGVPGRWPDWSDGLFDLTWNASSHALSESSNGFGALTDGETHSLTARLQFDVLRRLRIGLQLPWISHSGGFMDNLIDTWHDFFGLNEGIRPQLEQDQLNYVLRRQTTDVYRLNDSVSGVGDLHIGLAAELGSFARYADPGTVSGYFLRVPWRLVLNAKLPTGDIDRLTGSGNSDFAVGLGWRAPPDAVGRIRWWLDLGLVFPGDVDIVGLETESQAYYYDAAMTIRIVRRLDAIVQVAGNSALYAGDVSQLGDSSVQLAVGGLWHMSPRFGLRFGIVEDILPESAPDFGVELSLIVRRR